jgi:uncharacterized membrane protein
MKASDIQRLHEAGLISDDQRRAIIERFKLDRESNKLLVILSIIGALLVGSGIILLIASNWDSIPRLLKLVVGLALLLSAHGGGWAMARKGSHPIVTEALHLIGSGMFLANIALVGQIYHLSSRPPNAILLWLGGIIALPWILRSKAQHILSLCVFGLWIGLELNQPDSLLFFDGEARQFVFYAMLGLVFAGLGLLLARTRFADFGPATEKFGLLTLHIASYPLTLGLFYGSGKAAPGAWTLCGIVTVLAVALLLSAALHPRQTLNAQWRWVWTLAQGSLLALAWMGLTMKVEENWSELHRYVGAHWIAVPVLFIFCMVQTQVGLIRRSPWMVNLAIAFLALHITTAYFQLFGSMQTTGMMFVITGVFLIGLGIYLERKRRVLMKRMAAPPTSAAS